MQAKTKKKTGAKLPRRKPVVFRVVHEKNLEDGHAAFTLAFAGRRLSAEDLAAFFDLRRAMGSIEWKRLTKWVAAFNPTIHEDPKDLLAQWEAFQRAEWNKERTVS